MAAKADFVRAESAIESAAATAAIDVKITCSR